MQIRPTALWLSLALAPLASGAQQGTTVHDSMLSVAAELAAARSSGAPQAVIDELAAAYAELSERVGGDDPANARWGGALPASATTGATSGTGPAFVNTPTCGGGSSQTFTFQGGGGPIPTSAIDTFTLQVSGLPSYLWDVNLITGLLHTACQDLDVTLVSPAGTEVVITTDNGAVNDNVFNGTLWDDSVIDPVTDRVFTNLVTATPLSPEGRLAAFRGEDPNGTWKLRVADDAFGNTGSLASWSLEIVAVPGVSPSQTVTVSRTPALALADAALTVDALSVTSAGSYVAEVELYLEIRHTFCADLDIRLISPAGTSVAVTTDGGGSFDDVFRGTLFDVDAPLPVTDVLFTNLVAVPLVSPEGGFDAFLGQNPNGVWQLSITDDTATNVGTLDRWDLSIRTLAAPTLPPPASFSGTTGAITDFGPGAPTAFPLTVSGVLGSLWDVDLTTFFVHAACADLDFTLTSPSGRTVVISTDNGFTGGVFNGTLWDDNANDPATDRFYTTNVVATPLSPEGRLSAFRGDTANGTWTLTVADDTPSVAGSLTSWSLALSTVPAAPALQTATFTSSPNVPIPDFAAGQAGSISDMIPVSGVGTDLLALRLYVELEHTWSDDLEVFLTSPAGTRVTVITDCGGGNDNVFDGTLFDPSSVLPPTDHAYQDMIPEPLLAPEGSFDNFVGEDPNGLWTLEVRDDFGGDQGTFVRWDLQIDTCSTAVPLVYCNPIAPGSSSGCLPVLSAPVNPNIAHAGPCVLTLSQVEGQRAGLFFYGVSGSQQLSWCNGPGSSFLCVRPPTQRTASLASGGTPGQCDGVFTLDWNAFQLANPGAIGAPFAVGATVDVQGWFRDPGSCKTTFLTPAATLTYAP